MSSTKQTFIKLDPFMYPDKHKILDKVDKICCDKDCHSITLSYHIKNPLLLILTVFHKGSFQFNIRYDYKKKAITYKSNRECGCDCLDRDLIDFIAKNTDKIKYWFRKEVRPINTALDENKMWQDKSTILDEYLYPDLVDVVSKYLCYFGKCGDCNQRISGAYDRCWTCYNKND